MYIPLRLLIVNELQIKCQLILTFVNCQLQKLKYPVTVDILN